MPSKTILTILVVLVCISCVKKPVENKETVSANSVIEQNNKTALEEKHIYIEFLKPIKGYKVLMDFQFINADSCWWKDYSYLTTNFISKNGKIAFSFYDTVRYNYFDSGHFSNGQKFYISNPKISSKFNKNKIFDISEIMIYGEIFGFIDLDTDGKDELVFGINNVGQRFRPIIQFFTFPDGKEIFPQTGYYTPQTGFYYDESRNPYIPTGFDKGAMVDLKNKRIIQDITSGWKSNEYDIYEYANNFPRTCAS